MVNMNFSLLLFTRHAMKMYGGSTGIAPRTQVVSFTPDSVTTGERQPHPHPLPQQ
jgi:hypothetical protein